MGLGSAKGDESACGTGWQPADRLPIGPGEPRSPGHLPAM